MRSVQIYNQQTIPTENIPVFSYPDFYNNVLEIAAAIRFIVSVILVTRPMMGYILFVVWQMIVMRPFSISFMEMSRGRSCR